VGVRPGRLLEPAQVAVLPQPELFRVEPLLRHPDQNLIADLAEALAAADDERWVAEADHPAVRLEERRGLGDQTRLGGCSGGHRFSIRNSYCFQSSALPITVRSATALLTAM
jgi:hypothetical protein